MNLEEKNENQQEEQEAKAYFKEHNDEQLEMADYIKALIIGVLVAVVGGYFLQLIADFTGYNFVYLFMLVGYGVGYAIKRVVKTGNMVLGIVAALSYFIGVACGIVVFVTLQFGMDRVSNNMMVIYFRNLVSHIPTLIIIIVGAVVAFMSTKE